MDDPWTAGSLLGRIGFFHHLAGDVPKARRYLELALRSMAEAEEGDPAAASRWLRDRVQAETRLADLLHTRGDYRGAEALCERALRRIEEGPTDDPEIRREQMVLLETLAKLHLRRFRFAEGEDLFERGLQAGESLGETPEKALILNNLGVLYGQTDRFREAIEALERAQRLASQLGQDKLLVSCLSNLAVLYAKTGDREKADETVRQTQVQDTHCNSMRTLFLRTHSAAIVDLLSGRYASSVTSLREAISLGEELGDVHMLAFDLVYLAECHLQRSELKGAAAALSRAESLTTDLPGPLRSMIRARQAVAAGLIGRVNESREALEQCGDCEVPYLRAWNRVFRGWAFRLLDNPAEARQEAESARSFFARVKMPTGEVHSLLELVEIDALQENHELLSRHLKEIRGKFQESPSVAKNPMLAARWLAYQTRAILDQPCPDLEKASALLVEAESHLIGRRLRALEALTRSLRRRLQAATLESLPTPTAAVRFTAPGTFEQTREAVGDLTDSTEELLREFENVLETETPGWPSEERERLRRRVASYGDRLRSLLRSLDDRPAQRGEAYGAHSILGSSKAMARVREFIVKVAQSDLTVLVTGETGTGKELVARAVHGEGPRRSAPFVGIDCAALPDDLFEAELFGYVQGAFSGAERDRRGFLHEADGGTVFFDEISAVPLPVQAKLLRVLESRSIRPLGSHEEVQLDLRWVFSTNRDLTAQVRDGAFREDLLYRLLGIEIHVPPLREHLEDIPALTSHFRELAGFGSEGPTLLQSAMNVLFTHSWPGNVRELQSAVARLMVTCTGQVEEDDVKGLLGETTKTRLFSSTQLRAQPLKPLLAQLEREYLRQLGRDLGGDVKVMASTLGITVRALYKRFNRLGLRPKEFHGD